MLLKYCTQHVSKFGKLSSGHRTGKGQFSFQSQRKAMPKNVQSTTKFHLFHTLAKWYSIFSKFSKPVLENFELYFTSVWDECNCAVVWAFFGIAFLWDWNEIWAFPVLWPLLSFPNLLAYWVQHFRSIIFQDLESLNWNSITSTSFVRNDAF